MRQWGINVRRKKKARGHFPFSSFFVLHSFLVTIGEKKRGSGSFCGSFCRQENAVDSTFFVWCKEPSQIYVKKFSGLHVFRETTSPVSLNSPQASHWTALNDGVWGAGEGGGANGGVSSSDLWNRRALLFFLCRSYLTCWHFAHCFIQLRQLKKYDKMIILPVSATHVCFCASLKWSTNY